jgi:hypothetical protein
VPPLEETLAKYLRSLQPFEALGAPSFPYTRARDSIVFDLTPLWCAMPGIFSPEEMKRTRALAEEFKAAGGRGQRLQSKLVARSQQKRNWLEEWWYVLREAPSRSLSLTAVLLVAQKAQVRVQHLAVPYAGERVVLLPLRRNGAGTRTPRRLAVPCGLPFHQGCVCATLLFWLPCSLH